MFNKAGVWTTGHVMMVVKSRLPTMHLCDQWPPSIIPVISGVMWSEVPALASCWTGPDHLSFDDGVVTRSLSWRRVPLWTWRTRISTQKSLSSQRKGKERKDFPARIFSYLHIYSRPQTHTTGGHQPSFIISRHHKTACRHKMRYFWLFPQSSAAIRSC